ncbi:PepSY domain-containing protein [Methylobacterium sp. WL103]|nr:PepSY domain-containing protein [Methylobacterium sp. WL12]TXM95792.1 PepSY domain-containing protein [Methylobacterium sp. WL103]
MVAGLGVAGLAAPASAQGIQIGPGGVRVDPGYRDRGPRDDVDLSRGEAIRIARRQGLTDVDNVDRRGPRIIVRGSDRRGDDITVVVDSRSGDVIDVRR